MAMDAAIFQRYLEDGVPVFRVYGWSAPSFTYGVSQDPGNILNMDLCRKDGVGVAGRMTGGGVLFHDDEITYSFVCGKEDVGEPAAHLVAYREICAFLINFYRSLGLEASFAVETKDFKARSQASELCAASHEKYDIVIGTRKIGGNAQKRSRRAIFQHGSIPLSIDRALERGYLKDANAQAPLYVTSLSGELKKVPGRKMLEDKLIETFGLTFGAGMKEEGFCFETAVAG